jgi:3-methyladenine DNA glycosylase Tag
MEILTREQILERRKEIEQELSDFLSETKSNFGLEDIKNLIYNEEETDDMMKIVAMFDNGQGAADLDNVMETVSDAWNYFPHKILGNLSPAEKALERSQPL